MTKINSKNFDYVVFDFDGVLVESTTLKTNIFREVIKDYSTKEQEEFITYHMLHGGVSRWEKFTYFLKEIVKVNNDEVLKIISKKLADSFTALLSEKLKSLDLTVGSMELLCELKRLNKPCFIVSGGAQTEVVSVCERNKIDSYFKNILGSPKNKQENLTFLKESNELKGIGLFIGDSYTDFKSAKDFNMHFIFMDQFTEWADANQYEKHFYLTVKNLAELKQYLEEEDN